MRWIATSVCFAVALLLYESAAQAQSQVVQVTVHSPGLEHNLLGDPADQKVAVYLPAAYRAESDRRFASIYFLHGFADTPVERVAEILQGYMDKLIAAHAIEPMIVIAPNGLNLYFGSFYTNSEVTGNWEEYIVRDVVGCVDSHYRTIPAAKARGISGHSMGGYGALMLGFKHPDVFSSVYAMSPCCTVLEADLGSSNPLWSRVAEVKSAGELQNIVQREFLLAVFVAMDAAFAPDPRNPPLFGDAPYQTQGQQLVPDPATLSRLEGHMVANAIPALLPRISQLHGIYIEYGAEEDFRHIPLGARAVSAQLAVSGIPHVLEVYEGNRGNHVRERIEKSVFPWFSKTIGPLSFSEQKIISGPGQEKERAKTRGNSANRASSSWSDHFHFQCGNGHARFQDLPPSLVLNWLMHPPSGNQGHMGPEVGKEFDPPRQVSRPSSSVGHPSAQGRPEAMRVKAGSVPAPSHYGAVRRWDPRLHRCGDTSGHFLG